MSLRKAVTVGLTSVKTNTRTASVAHFSGDSWKEREHSMENAFFNKEDEKSLRKLLKKLKSQADTDSKGKAEHEEHDKQGLESVLKGVQLTDEQKEALLKWKHEH